MDSLLAWSPIIDGNFLTQQPIDGLNKGSQNVPILLGTNENEGDLFVYGGFHEPLPDDTYQCVVDILFGATTARNIFGKDDYKPAGGHNPDNRPQASRLLTDYTFTCANRHAAANGATHGLWAYQFDHVPSYNVWTAVPECSQKVCHGAEIDFVFNSAGQIQNPFQGQELALALLMNGYWATFAVSLDPKTGTTAGVTWPKFTSSAKNRLLLQTPVSNVKTSTDLGANCDFWDTVGYSGRREGVGAALLFCAAHPLPTN